MYRQEKVYSRRFPRKYSPANDREADIYSFMRSYLYDELGGMD